MHNCDKDQHATLYTNFKITPPMQSFLWHEFCDLLTKFVSMIFKPLPYIFAVDLALDPTVCDNADPENDQIKLSHIYLLSLIDTDNNWLYN